MAIILGGDSSVDVTRTVSGKSIFDYASQQLGTVPQFWGRYFSRPGHSDGVDYDPTTEAKAFADMGIRLLPIARQTTRVGSGNAEGVSDGARNAEQIINALGAKMLANQGRDFLVFLDVENGIPSLTADYYSGWATTLRDHSAKFTEDKVTLLPCIYGNRSDMATWNELNLAYSDGAPCEGVWVTHSVNFVAGTPPTYDGNHINPPLILKMPTLLWQYALDIPNGNGIDCNMGNPNVEGIASLLLERLPRTQ